MKVLYASFDEVPSFKGASTHILSSSRASVRAHELHLVTLGGVTLPRLYGLRHHPQPLTEPNYLRRGLAFRARVACIAHDIRPDVGHFRSPWEGIALLDAGVPCVYEVNGLPSLELQQTYRDIPASAVSIFRDWETRCLRQARIVICPSPRIRDHLVSAYDATIAHKVHVVPNGYDLVPALGPRVGSSLRMVYLGTLHPWQGLFRILRGLVELGDRVTLDVYAPSNRAWQPLLEKRILRYGLSLRVKLHRPMHRARLAATLPSYDLGIAPLLKTERNTTQGCDPIKILDYLSHGLPVVAPDLFVARQALTHELNGLLYAADDVRSFVAAVVRLDEDRALLRRLRDHAQPSLRARPTWAQHGEHISSLYESLVSFDA